MQQINISQLEISKLNVRKNINIETLEDLKNSIQINGLLNPLTVKFNNETNKYEIIAGQRRFIVLKELNYELIICNVISNDKNNEEQIIISLSENVHRANMLLSERIKTINYLTNKFDGDYKKISELTHISIKTIKQYNKLSHFPDFIIDMLDSKGNEKISLEFAVHLSNLDFITNLISENKSIDKDNSDLIKIIEVFLDVKSSDRLNIIKKLMTNKITEKNLYTYIAHIGNIKLKYLEEQKLKEQEEQRIKDERIKKELEEQRIKDEHAQLKELEEQKIKNIANKNKEIETSEEIFNEKIKQNINNIYITTKTRNPELQKLYRDAIITRYNRCVVSDMSVEVCEAAHIIPFSKCENFDINNGLLLNSILHKLFDKYYWSINPNSLCIEINKVQYQKIFDFLPVPIDIYNILKPYENKHIKILSCFPKTIINLQEHYKEFKSL